MLSWVQLKIGTPRHVVYWCAHRFRGELIYFIAVFCAVFLFYSFFFLHTKCTGEAVFGFSFSSSSCDFRGRTLNWRCVVVAATFSFQCQDYFVFLFLFEFQSVDFGAPPKTSYINQMCYPQTGGGGIYYVIIGFQDSEYRNINVPLEGGLFIAVNWYGSTESMTFRWWRMVFGRTIWIWEYAVQMVYVLA